MCPTCVYRKGSPLDPRYLEDAVRDRFGGFSGYRVCHSSKTACCRGFWNRHKDRFAMGRIAQRLNLVIFVTHDVTTRISKTVKRAWDGAKSV